MRKDTGAGRREQATASQVAGSYNPLSLSTHRHLRRELPLGSEEGVGDAIGRVSQATDVVGR